MDVSVVLPIRDEAAAIGATLRAVLALDAPPGGFEVIAVDGRSTDATRDIVRGLQVEHPNLTLLDNPKRLSSAARNVGVAAARGRFVVVIDGHCEVRSRTYLQDLVTRFEQTGADALGRPQPLDVTGASLLQRAIALARASRLGHNPGSLIYSTDGGPCLAHSVAVAYRREVVARLGGFDERFDACEDVEFNHRFDRAGLRCHFAPELAVHYRPRGTLSGLAYQMARYGRGRARLLRKHPDTLRPGPLVPAAFLLAVAGTFVLGFVAPAFATLFCLVMLAYTAAVACATVGLAARHPAGLLTPAAFLAIHIGAGWGVLSELRLRDTRRFAEAFRNPLA